MSLSTRSQLIEIAGILEAYLRLPFSQGIPGAVLEHALAHVRGGMVLPTYDFVDVVDEEKGLGWQVKSTMARSPLTWIRAKLPNKDDLILESHGPAIGPQSLGNAIIKHCNDHIARSLEEFNLNQLFYARLIRYKDDRFLYFERPLTLDSQSRLFVPEDYYWRWAEPKVTKSKQQLPALHGFESASGKPAFAWHGRGENQLHFKAERTWWPEGGSPNSISFSRPDSRMSVSELIDFLAANQDQ